jgi:YidC/Oxa1 family membrane protein insertase
MFQAAAWLIATFYEWISNYAIAISLVAVAVMLLITPLTLKSTKGMLEMQRLQPEMRRIQNQYRGDRQQMNQEMMKLYQEHKVNPLASCLPLLAQMPVFIIMFRVLNQLGRMGDDGTLDPGYISKDSSLYKDLDQATEMVSFGLNLAISPAKAMSEDFATGIWYALLIVVLAGLFFLQQRMVASRVTSPSMSPVQAKIMQYLPVVFALFQLFLPTSLVFYYITQALVRIAQQYYITKRFYGSDHSIGRQAQAASVKAREMKDDDKNKEITAKKKDDTPSTPAIQSKRVTAPKNRPTPSGKPARPGARAVPPSKRNK